VVSSFSQRDYACNKFAKPAILVGRYAGVLAVRIQPARYNRDRRVLSARQVRHINQHAAEAEPAFSLGSLFAAIWLTSLFGFRHLDALHNSRRFVVI
jgi:hypothetical protein